MNVTPTTQHFLDQEAAARLAFATMTARLAATIAKLPDTVKVTRVHDSVVIDMSQATEEQKFIAQRYLLDELFPPGEKHDA